MCCPNCKAQNANTTGYICKSCNIDMIAFTKSMRVSKILYNKGIAKANQGELTIACDILTQSIQFNKNNHLARNLLGLIYFEIGQVGSALKQWIVSANKVKKDNNANNYIQKLQNNTAMLYSYNDAVLEYNKAYENVTKKNIDVAIKQLKKAINLNPNLVKALNLLTFCYLVQGQREGALKLITHTLELDVTNAIAINYHFTLTGKPPKISQTAQKATIISKATKPPSIYHTVEEKLPTYSFISLSHIISFTLGGALIFGLLFFFVMPNWVGDMDTQISSLTSEVLALTTSYNELQSQSQDEISQLNQENRALEIQLQSVQHQVNIINQQELIETAQSLVATNQFEEAADILYNIDVSLVQPEDVTSVQNLMNTAFHQAAYSLYNTGLSNYNLGNFEIAIGFFERSLRFAGLNEQSNFFIDDATYFLARIAQQQGNYDLALTLFNYVITNHPNSNLLSSATSRILEIEALLSSPQDEEY